MKCNKNQIMQNLILKLNLALSGNMTTKLHVYGIYPEALLAKSVKVHSDWQNLQSPKDFATDRPKGSAYKL